MPNFYHRGYECDIMSVTTSGIRCEFEVKISRADFKKDMEKGYKKWSWKGEEYTSEFIRKHDDLINGKHVNRFFYVVPENLIKIEELPPYAGLIYVSFADKWVHFKEIKSGKLLTKEKLDLSNKLLRQIAVKCQARYFEGVCCKTVYNLREHDESKD